MNRFPASAVLIAAVMAVTTPALIAAPPTSRTYQAGYFALELDGQIAGFVSKIEGGNVFGEVVKEPDSEDYFVKKHLSNGGIRDIVLEFGGGMNAALFNWMKAALQRQYAPKNGAVLSLDFNGNVVTRLDFVAAQITQITLPGVDGSSKEPLRFAVRLTPLAISLNRSGGGKASLPRQSLQKTGLLSSYRLSIDGLDMTRASKVEALTINLPLLTDPNAVCYKCEVVPSPPAAIDFPNVVVTLAASHANSVYDWLDDFVIQGDNSDESEKNGTLEYLSANLQTTLFQVAFQQLGIFEIAPVPATTLDGVARVTVSMYCERIEFTPLTIS